MTDPISITRVFEAPCERVWRAWTEPDRFADWFGGGARDVTMDVRIGGEQQNSPSPAQTSAAGYAWSRCFDRLAEQLDGGSRRTGDDGSSSRARSSRA